MKYYNFETISRSLKNGLTRYLKDNNIYYELSAGGVYWHFEILTNEAGANKINDFIDNITV